MARTLYPSREATMNWSASEWSLADDNAKNEVKPAAGDTVVLTANSTAALTLNEASAALLALDMTGYTGTLAVSNALTVTGAGILGGTFTGAAAINISTNITTIATANFTGYTGELTANGATGGTLTTNAATLPQIHVNKTNAGDTVTCAAAVTAKGFKITQGTYSAGAYSQNIGAGGINRVAGTMSVGTATWTITANTSVVKNAIASSSMPVFAIAAGVTATASGNVFCKKLTLPATSTLAMGTNQLWLASISVNGFWDVEGTVTFSTGSLVWNKINANPGSFPVNLANKSMLIYTDSVGTYSITLGAAINIGTGDLIVGGTGTSCLQTLNMGGYNLTCNDLGLGASADNNGSGVVTMGGGAASCRNINHRNTANTANALTVQGNLTLTGILDAAYIAVTAVVGNQVHNGTVSNCAPVSGVLNCTDGVTDGGGNSANVAFAGDYRFAKGTMMMMGA